MTRLRLFQLRLAATAAMLLLVFGVIRLLWYPGAYFSISGSGKLFLVLIAVTVIVGPCLSAFAYKPGKKGLLLDLSLLAAVEVIVVLLAMSTIHARRPYYTVFAVDRFESVSRVEIDITKIANAAFHTRPGHEPRLVYAELPQDPDVLSNLIDETVLQGKHDIDRRPEFWRPYTAGIGVVKAAAKPLERLLVGDERRATAVQRWLARQEADASEFLYLPLRGKSGDATMIVHADVGFPVDILQVDPW